MSISKELDRILDDLTRKVWLDRDRHKTGKLDFLHWAGNKTKAINKAISKIKFLFKNKKRNQGRKEKRKR